MDYINWVLLIVSYTKIWFCSEAISLGMYNINLNFGQYSKAFQKWKSNNKASHANYLPASNKNLFNYTNELKELYIKEFFSKLHCCTHTRTHTQTSKHKTCLLYNPSFICVTVKKNCERRVLSYFCNFSDISHSPQCPVKVKFY